MEKDNAVRNQKVFVTLDGYTRLAAEYNRTVDELNAAKKTDQAVTVYWRNRKQAFEFVIDTLSLPIEKRLERGI